MSGFYGKGTGRCLVETLTFGVGVNGRFADMLVALGIEMNLI